jgi:ubiquitin C-terminal hydrolase
MSTSVLSILPINDLHFQRLERCSDEKEALNQNQRKLQSTKNREFRQNDSITDTTSSSKHTEENIFEFKSNEDHQLMTENQEYEEGHCDSDATVNDAEKTHSLEKSSDEIHIEQEATYAISTKTQDDLTHFKYNPVHFNNVNVHMNIPLKGIYNLGNTCYLASAIQMLLSVEGFVKEIIQSFQQQEDHSNCPLRDALAMFFISSHEQEDTSSNSNHLDPSALKKAIDDISDLFSGHWQQDAHEFLSTLLDILHDEISVKDDTRTIDNNCDDEEGTYQTNDEMRDCCTHSMRTSENDERSCSENDFVLVNANEDSLDKLESDTKKARLVREYSPTLSKTPSFSELNFDGINALLHGDNPKSHTQSVGHSSNLNYLKLIGGDLAADSSSMQNIQKEASCERSTSVEEKTPSPYHQSLCMDNPVDKYFAMEVRTHLTCDSCSHRSSHLEIYRHLSIEVGNNEDNPMCETSVTESLRSFFAPEKRHLKCEKCFSETATQTIEITKLPRALILHLKRFIVDVGLDYTSISYKKNLVPISFPEKLDMEQDKENSILTEFLATDVSYPEMEYIAPEKESPDNFEESNTSCFVKVPKSQYHIRSVVNHIGSNATCGHYTTDALRSYPSSSKTEDESSSIRKWTRFNDDYVSLVDNNQAVGTNAQKSAYMLLYEFE